MLKDITIVTVSTNKLDEDCLTSVQKLLQSTKLNVSYVVVDNNSTAFRAHEYVKKHVPRATIILRNKNHGYPAGNNLGVKEIPAKYYFFLNPDTKIEDIELLEKMFHFMENNQFIGIIGPKLIYMDGTVQETCRRFPKWYTPVTQRTNWIPKKIRDEHQHYFLMKDFAHDSIHPVDWVQGSAMFVRGHVFHELKGFDDLFFVYYEDVDLCRRSWAKNYPVYYVPHISFFHVFTKESNLDTKNGTSVLSNRMTRIHIASGIKYIIKWAIRRPLQILKIIKP